MTSFTLFSQGATGSHIDTATELLTNGIQFSISSPASLTGYWFFSGSGATQLPGSVALWDNTGTLVPGTQDTAAAWSGAAGSGWVKYTFASPVSLTTGITYTAGVSNNPTTGNQWYSITSGSWAGGITNGPLSCPDQADTFADFAFAFPNNAFGNFNIWLDVEVTTTTATVVTTGLSKLVRPVPYPLNITTNLKPQFSLFNPVAVNFPGAASSINVAANSGNTVTTPQNTAVPTHGWPYFSRRYIVTQSKPATYLNGTTARVNAQSNFGTLNESVTASSAADSVTALTGSLKVSKTGLSSAVNSAANFGSVLIVTVVKSSIQQFPFANNIPYPLNVIYRVKPQRSSQNTLPAVVTGNTSVVTVVAFTGSASSAVSPVQQWRVKLARVSSAKLRANIRYNPS
jgi:hypothetical protein